MAERRRLILGLGNRLLGDDGFGPAVVGELQRRGSAAAADVRCAGTDLLSEIETFGRYEEVVLVDAVLGGGVPGTVALLEESVFGEWMETSESAHQISPLMAVKLFRRLNPGSMTRIRLVALYCDRLDVDASVADTAVSAGVEAVETLVATHDRVAPVQICGSCRRSWSTWTDFLVDPAVRLLGLQAIELLPDANLLVFEHGCGSSVSVLTRRLHFLLPPDDPRREWPSLRGTAACRKHCLSLADLAACDRQCSNARDRDLIAIVQRMHDRPAPAVGGTLG